MSEHISVSASLLLVWWHHHADEISHATAGSVVLWCLMGRAIHEGLYIHDLRLRLLIDHVRNNVGDMYRLSRGRQADLWRGGRK